MSFPFLLGMYARLLCNKTYLCFFFFFSDVGFWCRAPAICPYAHSRQPHLLFAHLNLNHYYGFSTGHFVVPFYILFKGPFDDLQLCLWSSFQSLLNLFSCEPFYCNSWILKNTNVFNHIWTYGVVSIFSSFTFQPLFENQSKLVPLQSNPMDLIGSNIIRLYVEQNPYNWAQFIFLFFLFIAWKVREIRRMEIEVERENG